MWYTHIIEYYSATKGMKFWYMLATAWIEPWKHYSKWNKSDTKERTNIWSYFTWNIWKMDIHKRQKVEKRLPQAKNEELLPNEYRVLFEMMKSSGKTVVIITQHSECTQCHWKQLKL